MWRRGFQRDGRGGGRRQHLCICENRAEGGDWACADDDTPATGAIGLDAAARIAPYGGKWGITNDAEVASAAECKEVVSPTAAAKGGGETNVEAGGRSRWWHGRHTLIVVRMRGRPAGPAGTGARTWPHGAGAHAPACTGAARV